MIGRHYDHDEYNCAHFVADWYRQKFNIDFPTGDTFSRGFALWIRRHFEPLNSPEQNCLVVAEQTDGSLHVGVYDNYNVLHNYKAGDRKGGVCRWSLGSMKRTYKKITFWRCVSDRD